MLEPLARKHGIPEMKHPPRNRERLESISGRALIGAASAAAGAMLAYFLDPGSGARRRALHSDRLFRGMRETNRIVRRVASDLSGRGRGILPRLRNFLFY